MIAKVFYSTKPVLDEALLDIRSQLSNEEYDYIIFSISPEYRMSMLLKYVPDIFNIKKSAFFAFHSSSSFANNNIVNFGVVALFMKFEHKGKLSYTVVEDFDEENDNKEVLNKTYEYLHKHKDSLSVVISGVNNHDLPIFLEQFSTYLEENPLNNKVNSISGGLLLGKYVDSKFRTNIIAGGKVISSGFLIISFKNVTFDIQISLGFKPVGPTYEITKADDYQLYEVDGRPINKIIEKITKNIDNFHLEYFYYLPLMILDEEDGYVSVLRTIRSIEKDSVEFYAPLRNNTNFKFTFADENDILRSDKASVIKMKRKIGGKVDLLFNFSCVARQYVLNDKKEDEIELYYNDMNSEIFGFISAGEIAPDKLYRKLKLYNETSVLIGLIENE